MSKLEQKKMIRNMLIAIAILSVVYLLGFEKSVFLLVGILSINLILFIHELGHYLIARVVKMPVYEFSVGVGPKIYSKTINNIEYCVRCIPLGGYVVFENVEELDEKNPSDEYSESAEYYRSMHPLKRMAVILAGPVFNFILAFVIIVGLYMNQGFTTTKIKEVVDSSPAMVYGLQAGDTILSINNTPINTWDDVISITSKNENLTFKVDRNGKEEILNVVSKLDNETNTYKVGISPIYEKNMFKSVVLGAETTIRNIKATADGYVQIIKDAFSRKDKTETELVGPIGTIQTISESVQYGLDSLMIMVFSMSISVGIFNLIPLIPNLDGGRLLFVFIEILRGGKQFSKKVEENILVTGAYIMMGLFLLITMKDVFTLF